MHRTALDAAVGAEKRLRELLMRAKGGDEAAYREFLRALANHLRAFLRKRLQSNHEDVEDLLQEVLLAIHTRRHTYRSSEPLTPWVHAIARYKIVDLLRSRANREALNDVIDDETELFAQSDHAALEARRDISQLLKDLPERQRLPIWHVKLGGLSVVETARVTGMSESAVKVGIYRGIRAMMSKVKGRR